MSKHGSDHEMVCGGTGPTQKPDTRTIVACKEVRDTLESKVGWKFTQYTPVSVKKQVVAGINYFVKILVKPDYYIHARIYESLQGKVELHSYQCDKSLEDEIEYF